MFSKVLVANRGEIAVRVIRACRSLGIGSVAIYSQADKDAMHVRDANEAYCVGPGPAGRSYLDVANIVSTALATKCDAVHPGYGFLAENARFAEICSDHGLVFIGPKPSVIATMGDKAVAKRTMKDAGVATTPGSDILESAAKARDAAKRIGYPVLLKATAGGGGKGMRVVERPEDMERSFASATAEAEASFKDGRVYLEKLLAQPRHIEVQVLADEHGTVVHLGERDCSIQKPSHQKLVEEAPAPHLHRKLRSSLHDMAIKACRSVGYTNAGTLEFLVAGDHAYFMEMNTRVQVEHPVTEMVYGVDIVKEQICVAAGEALGFSQRDLTERGHAIECRINAEDAKSNFAPEAGTIARARFAQGPGIRVDTHVYDGAIVPPYYDSLLAKIVAFGETRETAIERMETALRDTTIEGVHTTLAQCLEILATPEFREGRYDIGFLPRLASGVAAEGRV
ncbi:MAG: acetyl-CoA carboxylase biotin carboxylase subunit [Candidatus Tyrphobacter sp.]